ncbi:hypothetical protein GCM10010270_06620 [Streptomyces violaceus]|uniref:hypothetical protein n=1 Tax=Streptomyces violaceus TaxID=1936 RepID=UPI001876E040|nr:hypothetical protein [Streptomyces janthinus]GGS39783.1 hypothetical protein GCM10010270_06620 [Streptomyces janthinus]
MNNGQHQSLSITPANLSTRLTTRASWLRRRSTPAGAVNDCEERGVDLRSVQDVAGGGKAWRTVTDSGRARH